MDEGTGTEMFCVTPDNTTCGTAAWRVGTPDGEHHFVRASIGFDDESPSGYSFMCDLIGEDPQGEECVVYGLSLWGYRDARELRECIPDLFFFYAPEDLSITELSCGKTFTYKDFQNLDKRMLAARDNRSAAQQQSASPQEMAQAARAAARAGASPVQNPVRKPVR